MPLSGGSSDTASCTTSPGVGTEAVTASYTGDANYAASSGTFSEEIDPDTTTSTLTVPSTPVTTGTPVTLTDTVSGNGPATGTPGGTVDFADDGSPIAGCQGVPLSGGASDTATCTTTPAIGSHAVTATYSGDSDDASSTASGSFVVVGSPTAAIGAPPSGGTYAVGQSVPTSFSCHEAANGPGVSSCTDGNGATGGSGALDTRTPGAHTYTVTATSADGLTGTASVTYTVAAAPTVSLTTPASGATYALGQSVKASYSCAEGAGGPGLAASNGCVGTVGNGAAINTTAAGTYSFTVTATSADGQTATSVVGYSVSKAPTKLVANSVLAGLLGNGLSATLTRSDTGAPLSGQTLLFSVRGQTICQATTNAGGTGTCSSVRSLVQAILNFGYTVSFAGTSNYQAASGSGKLL